jgi:hypothetical protein
LTTKDEKRRRRSVSREYKRDEIERSLAACPLSEADLRALIEWVDGRVIEEGCERDLTHARAFIEAGGLPAEASITWLNEHGGYCDCEIANVEDRLGWVK